MDIKQLLLKCFFLRSQTPLHLGISSANNKTFWLLEKPFQQFLRQKTFLLSSVQRGKIMESRTQTTAEVLDSIEGFVQSISTDPPPPVRCPNSRKCRRIDLNPHNTRGKQSVRKVTATRRTKKAKADELRARIRSLCWT